MTLTVGTVGNLNRNSYSNKIAFGSILKSGAIKHGLPESASWTDIYK